MASSSGTFPYDRSLVSLSSSPGVLTPASVGCHTPSPLPPLASHTILISARCSRRPLLPTPLHHHHHPRRASSLLCRPPPHAIATRIELSPASSSSPSSSPSSSSSSPRLPPSVTALPRHLSLPLPLLYTGITASPLPSPTPLHAISTSTQLPITVPSLSHLPNAEYPPFFSGFRCRLLYRRLLHLHCRPSSFFIELWS